MGRGTTKWMEKVARLDGFSSIPRWKIRGGVLTCIALQSGEESLLGGDIVNTDLYGD